MEINAIQASFSEIINNENFLNNIATIPPLSKCCVAVSGGQDSTFMLIAMHTISNITAFAKSFKLYPVCIDHGLRDAQDEIHTLRNICNALGLELTVRKVNVVSTGNTMNQARIARYDALKAFCKEQGILYLMTGHTLTDKFETFIMRKASGYTCMGLATIPTMRYSCDACIVRPIISFTRPEITTKLQELSIPYSSDPTNENIKFSRARVRKDIYECTYDLRNIQQQISKYLHDREGVQKAANEIFINNIYLMRGVVWCIKDFVPLYRKHCNSKDQYSKDAFLFCFRNIISDLMKGIMSYKNVQITLQKIFDHCLVGANQGLYKSYSNFTWMLDIHGTLAISNCDLIYKQSNYRLDKNILPEVKVDNSMTSVPYY